MKRWNLILYAILIVLPGVLTVGAGTWLVCAHVPAAIRHEPSRIGRAYRDVAEDLLARPETATHSGPREKGWRQRGKINGVSWGYVPSGDQVTVWHQVGKRDCRAVRMPALRPFPHALVFYWGGAFVAMVLLGLSGLAVWSFVRFMRERDDFLAATAHDLTTPLVGMRMAIGRNDEDARNLNERMLRLVENIRDFLKLGGKRPPPTRKPFDLLAAYREAYALFAADYRDLLDGEDVRVVGGEAPLPVCADETMTVQILWNLLGNDLKYAAPYGKVEVRFAREGRHVKAEFADEGQGMTRRQMRRAFDRYYRAKTVLESGKGGFGIGLCTAKEFAEAMGGGLIVRANAPRGCVFTLTLPAADGSLQQPVR